MSCAYVPAFELGAKALTGLLDLLSKDWTWFDWLVMEWAEALSYCWPEFMVIICCGCMVLSAIYSGKLGCGGLDLLLVYTACCLLLSNLDGLEEI